MTLDHRKDCRAISFTGDWALATGRRWPSLVILWTSSNMRSSFPVLTTWCALLFCAESKREENNSKGNYLTKGTNWKWEGKEKRKEKRKWNITRERRSEQDSINEPKDVQGREVHPRYRLSMNLGIPLSTHKNLYDFLVLSISVEKNNNGKNPAEHNVFSCISFSLSLPLFSRSLALWILFATEFLLCSEHGTRIATLLFERERDHGAFSMDPLSIVREWYASFSIVRRLSYFLPFFRNSKKI